MIQSDYLKQMVLKQGVSEKEWEVLSLVLEGVSIKKISTKLDILPGAARKRLGEVYKKFEIEGAGPGKLAKLQQKFFADYQKHLEDQSSQEVAQASEAKDGRQSAKSHESVQKPGIDWGNAPEMRQFYGRQTELDQLNEAIGNRNCGLISIVGIKGIGKTSLAVELTEQIKSDFDFVFWRSLECQDEHFLLTTLKEFITYVSFDEVSTTNLSDHETVDKALELLRNHRCLMIIDGFDKPPTSDPDLNLSSLYRDFLNRIGTKRHCSEVILTHRENPQDIAILDGIGYPVTIRMLQGLKPADANQILGHHGLKDKSHWPALIQVFGGNPLALQFIAVTIQRVFQGKVGEFLKQETITLNQIDDLVAQQFDILSVKEKTVLSCLVIKEDYSTLVTFAELKKALKYSGAELLETLESLMRRSLVQGDSHFVINPMIKKYLTHFLQQFLQQGSQKEKLPQKDAEIRKFLEDCFKIS